MTDSRKEFTTELTKLIHRHGSAQKALEALESKEPPYRFRKAHRILKEALQICAYSEEQRELLI